MELELVTKHLISLLREVVATWCGSASRGSFVVSAGRVISIRALGALEVTDVRREVGALRQVGFLVSSRVVPDEWKTVSENEMAHKVKVDKNAGTCTESEMNTAFFNLKTLAHGSLHEESVLRSGHDSPDAFHGRPLFAFAIRGVKHTSLGDRCRRRDIFFSCGCKELSRDTTRALIVLDSHTDAGLVLVSKQARVTGDALTLDDLAGQADQLVVVIGDHHIANRVVSLDLTNGMTVD